jgi:hypothetical protein
MARSSLLNLSVFVVSHQSDDTALGNVKWRVGFTVRRCLVGLMTADATAARVASAAARRDRERHRVRGAATPERQRLQAVPPTRARQTS